VVTLENSGMCLSVYKRFTGWGWVEISNTAGELIAVLVCLGKVDPMVSGCSAAQRSVGLGGERAASALD
jgi:hypothetical protein